MRFDNPIKDHGFTFPDIADFPDVKNEKRYMGNGDVTMLYEAVQKKDLNMFEKGYKSYRATDVIQQKLRKERDALRK